MFPNSPIMWQSKLQSEIALSTMEAKIIALDKCFPFWVESVSQVKS